MKKLFKTLAYIALWIFIASFMTVTIYEYHHKTKQDLATSRYTHATDNFYIDKSCDDWTVSTMNKLIDSLPPIFVTEFREDWVVIIEDKIKTPSDWPSNVSIDAYTHWQTRTIILKNQDADKMLNVFAHELGHCFDFEYGSPSYSDVFREIYGTYRDTFLEQDPYATPRYATASPVEFFATCFKEYLLYPEHLKAEAPKAYNFVHLFYNNVLEMEHGYWYDFGAVANTLKRIAEG